MDYLEIPEFITSIAVAIVTLLGRYIYTLLTKNNERMKTRSSSVELIDKVINEREWKKQENHLVVEEAFEQLYSKPLHFYEIKTLLYSKTPNSAFRTYLKYRPLIESNKKKTKFKYKKGKRPYWFIEYKNIRIPKIIIKGVLAYILFGLPASYAMPWLINDAPSFFKLKEIIFLWAIDGLLWFLAIIFLIDGLKYQSSEKEIVRDLGDKFELI